MPVRHYNLGLTTSASRTATARKRLTFTALFLISTTTAFAEEAVRTESTTTDLFTVLERGGPVMWSVAAVLFIGTVLGFERLIDLTRRRHAPRDFEKDLIHVADARGIDAGISLCREKPSSLARVLSAALQRHGAPLAKLETAVRNEVYSVRYHLLRNTRVIGWLAALAPIQALLSIVLNMIGRLGSEDAAKGAAVSGLLISGLADSLPCVAFARITALLLLGLFFVTRARACDLAQEILTKSTDAVLTLDRKARQSIRLIEDIEEKIKTESMIRVPDLSAEFDEHGHESAIKTAVTTHAGEAVDENPPVDKASETKINPPASPLIPNP